MAGLRNKLWTPTAYELELGDHDHVPEGPDADIEVRDANLKDPLHGKRGRAPKAILALRALGPGPHPTNLIAETAELTRAGAIKQLRRAIERGGIVQVGDDEFKLT